MISAEATADFLETLWRQGQTIDALPDDLRPADTDEALAVQSAYIARYPSCGWKIGATPDGGWLAAPLRGEPLPGGASLAGNMPPAVEVEVALTLGASLLADSTEDQARAAIRSFHLAFELFGSRYKQPKAVDASSVLADNLNNAGVIVGDARLPAEAQATEITIDFHRDGEDAGRHHAPWPDDGFASGLIWLADYAAKRGKPLSAGDIIITGARIGPVPLQRSARYEARSSLGTLAFTT
ncbi:2-keto-4-pentenoate hydratase [Devosia sp. DBB001]|nr:2-keto-4-pentenoate hydratase [Devosia sp. DBB001]